MAPELAQKCHASMPGLISSDYAPSHSFCESWVASLPCYLHETSFMHSSKGHCFFHI